MGFPEPAERFTRVDQVVQLAVNTKEHEAVLNSLFIGNHIYKQRHTARLLKLVSMIEAI